MKTTLLIFFTLTCLAWPGSGQGHPIKPHEPKITLFESVDVIRGFMKNKTKYDYSDRNLIEVSLKFLEVHPRKGGAWVYRFAHKTPTLGDDISIFHFTDGEIIEFHHGP